MNNVVAFREAPLPMRPRDYTPSQLALVRRTVAKDCDNTEFDLFIEIAKRVGLDPFRRQIYAIVTNKGNADKRQMVTVTGIDGYRAVAARNSDYRPDEQEPEYTYDEALKNPDTNPLGLVKAVVTAFKGDKPVRGVAYWEEFAPLKEEWKYDPEQGKKTPSGVFKIDATSNWRKMGRIMLAKCAEAQALRKGWPEDLSGVYVTEEMHQAIDVTPSEAVEADQRDQRRALIGAKSSIPLLFNAGDAIEMVPLGQVVDRVTQHIASMDSPTGLEKWRDVNQASLKQFWAESKADALEVKRLIETRAAQLAAE